MHWLLRISLDTGLMGRRVMVRFYQSHVEEPQHSGTGRRSPPLGSHIPVLCASTNTSQIQDYHSVRANLGPKKPSDIQPLVWSANALRAPRDRLERMPQESQVSHPTLASHTDQRATISSLLRWSKSRTSCFSFRPVSSQN